MTTLKKIIIPLIGLVLACGWLYGVYYHHPQEKEISNLVTDKFWHQKYKVQHAWNRQIQYTIDNNIKAYPPFRTYGPKVIGIIEKGEEIDALIEKIQGNINEKNNPKSKELITKLNQQMDSLKHTIVQLFSSENTQDLNHTLQAIDIESFDFKGLTIPEAILLLYQYRYTIQYWIYAALKQAEKETTIYKHELLYKLIALSEKDIITLGETYKADISLPSYVAFPDSLIQIIVNSDTLAIQESLGKYTLPTARKGTKILELTIKTYDGYKNSKTYEKTFKYQVK